MIVAAATTWPETLGLPFTHWSVRKLADHLARSGIRIGRVRLRQILHARGISFLRTRTWKESADPDKDAKLDRIEYVTSRYGRSGCARPTTARMASGTSTAATPSAMTSCGAWSGGAKAPITPWPHRSRSERRSPPRAGGCRADLRVLVSAETDLGTHPGSRRGPVPLLHGAMRNVAEMRGTGGSGGSR